MDEHNNLEKQPDLTILLPAYNEAENLVLLIPQIKAVVARSGISSEIIILDTQTPLDQTPDICRENQVICLARQGGNRYGDAIRTGIKASRGKFVLTMDSDGSHNPEFITQLWQNRVNADVVIASRYIPGGATDNPWILVSLSRVLNIVFKLLVGMPVYDISNSFRIYKGDLLRSVHPTYENFNILEEILAKIIWGKAEQPVKVLEIPFHFEQRKYGKPKRKLIVFGLQFLTALFKLRSLRNQSKSR